MFNSVYFEISGSCNAKCKYCQSGVNSLSKKGGRYVDLHEFKKSVNYMLNSKFISNNTVFGLYNWGEPYLHPEFKSIIRHLSDLQIRINLSTNASVPVLFETNTDLKYLTILRFSMPGFSQNSYDKIHGFDFNKIKENILLILENYRKCGFTGVAEINFHMYQFNLREIPEALKFANENKLEIIIRSAHFNDYNQLIKYTKDEWTYSELKSASKDLFLYEIEKRLEEYKKMGKDDYLCPQMNYLTIDEQCNVITCCLDSSVYKKIYDVNEVSEINSWRKKVAVCKECMELGLSYICHHPMRYDKFFKEDFA